ncbi:hypothetical protein ACFHYQ_27950 [Sphaerimonospora cavernae]|uniref:Serine/threonine protein kinase n=1 Tax=Sphaerimonospora cavernae TaxID=1740611 RepID=A0ABV6UD94_9ACTN
MSRPLQHNDPPRLGPFVLQARLGRAPAGLVYLGQGPDGRAVSVAVLTTGAALDAAARDRFVTVIRAAARRRGGGDLPPVVAMHDGQAPWVAVPYVPGGPGAERFLDRILVSGMLTGRWSGPDFAPYWLGDEAPALPAPPGPPPPPIATRRSVVLASALLAALTLTLAAVVWQLLFRGGHDPQPRPPLPATNFVPTPPPQPTEPEPQAPRESTTPRPGQPSPATSPRPGGRDDEGEPI